MILNWRFAAGTFGSSLAWALIASLVLQPCGAALAQTQTNCSSKLKQAEQKFSDALFDEVIVLLEPCMKDGNLTLEEKGRAYELLSKTYVAQSYIEQATTSIRKLLELVPNYKPNPERDTPPFIAQVEQIRNQMREEKEAAVTEPVTEAAFPQTWHLIAGGAVVAGVAAYFVFKKEEAGVVPPPPSVLPGPPSLP